jgi:hypothetical protein
VPASVPPSRPSYPAFKSHRSLDRRPYRIRVVRLSQLPVSRLARFSSSSGALSRFDLQNGFDSGALSK